MGLKANEFWFAYDEKRGCLVREHHGAVINSKTRTEAQKWLELEKGPSENCCIVKGTIILDL